jgi:hypothetical protein
VGLVLTATAAAAVLYGTVVLFALGPSSPTALGEVNVGRPQVVRVQMHLQDHRAATRPVPRLPQASPGRAQHVATHPRSPVAQLRVSRPRAVKATPRPAAQIQPLRSAAKPESQTPPAASPVMPPEVETPPIALPSLPELELPETPPLPVSLP